MLGHAFVVTIATNVRRLSIFNRVMALRYGGNMMSPTVEPDSFWPAADTLEKQIEQGRALYRSAGLAELDPDHAEHLTGKFAWSGFCQGCRHLRRVRPQDRRGQRRDPLRELRGFDHPSFRRGPDRLPLLSVTGNARWNPLMTAIVASPAELWPISTPLGGRQGSPS
jgi:hypothetical protein